MRDYQILHNPRCSKSRQTLELLRENGIEPVIIEYLKTAPTYSELDDICQKLGVEPSVIVRKKEAQFKALELNEASLSREQWLEILSQYPQLIERPIVLKGDQARVGRPPENVLELLDA